jgi:hypothetical protein
MHQYHRDTNGGYFLYEVQSYARILGRIFLKARRTSVERVERYDTDS